MEYIQPFLNSETPFLLLFVALFFYVIKTIKKERRLQKIIDEDLKTIKADLHVLMGVWKILLEKEVKKEGGKKNES